LFPKIYFCFLGIRSRQRFDTEDTINTAILESSCHLNGDDYEAATDQLPKWWDKCREHRGDYAEYRTRGVVFFCTVHNDKKKKLWNLNPMKEMPDIWHTYCYCIILKAITSTRLKSLGMLADDLVSRSVVKSYTGFKRVKGG
jgi:hypothetical protein